jgi:hypothetical protein
MIFGKSGLVTSSGEDWPSAIVTGAAKAPIRKRRREKESFVLIIDSLVFV